MRYLLVIFLIAVPSFLFAGAIEDGAPLADNFDLTLKVIQQLSTQKYEGLRPHKIDDQGWIYSYYISEFRFLGRAKTAVGFRNLFYVSYTRSAAYKPEVKSPARGFHYVLFVTDDGKIAAHPKTDAFSSEISLQGGVLTMEGEKIDLSSKEAMSHFE